MDVVLGLSHWLRAPSHKLPSLNLSEASLPSVHQRCLPSLLLVTSCLDARPPWSFGFL